MKVKVKSLSRVWVVATPWSVAHQAPLSIGFSRQKTGVCCHFLLQGISPTQGLNLPYNLPYCRKMLYSLSHQGTSYSIVNNILQFLSSCYYYIVVIVFTWMEHVEWSSKHQHQKLKNEGVWRKTQRQYWSPLLSKLWMLLIIENATYNKYMQSCWKVTAKLEVRI